MATGFTNIGNGGGGVKGLTATPQDVRQGLTFSRDGKTVENGALNLTNLLPENIKAGVNVGGVVGALSTMFGREINILSFTDFINTYNLNEVYLFVCGFCGSSICVNNCGVYSSTTKLIGYSGQGVVNLFKIQSLKNKDTISVPINFSYIIAKQDPRTGTCYSELPSDNSDYGGSLGNSTRIQLYRDGKYTNLLGIKTGGMGRVYWYKNFNGHYCMTSSSGVDATIEYTNHEYLTPIPLNNLLMKHLLPSHRKMADLMYSIIGHEYISKFQTKYDDVIKIFFTL